MAITVDDSAVLFDGDNPLKFLRDAEYDAAPPLVAFTDADNQILLKATDDGRLKVDAEFTLEGDVKIGAIEIQDRDSNARLDIVKIGDVSIPTDHNQGILAMGLDDNDTVQAIPLLDISTGGNPGMFQVTANIDGDYDVTFNPFPSTAGLIVHDRLASLTDAQLNFRPTGIRGTADNTVHALDIALHDEDGNRFTPDNPVPVTIYDTEEGEVTDVHALDAQEVDKKGGTVPIVNHDYVVTNGNTFHLRRVQFSSVVATKVTIQLGDGAASEVFTDKMHGYTTAGADRNGYLIFDPPLKVVGTADNRTLRVVKENRDSKDSDISTVTMGTLRAS